MPTIIGKIAKVSGIAMGMSSVGVVIAVDLVFVLLLTGYSRKGEGGK